MFLGRNRTLHLHHLVAVTHIIHSEFGLAEGEVGHLLVSPLLDEPGPGCASH